MTPLDGTVADGSAQPRRCAGKASAAGSTCLRAWTSGTSIERRDVVMAPISTGRFRDDTIAMRRDPYRFLSRRASELGEDVFETRLLLRPMLCMTGPEAARIFYDPARFQRAGAAPPPLQKTLFGKGGVQGLDGGHHRQRKAMFLELNRPGQAEALSQIVRRRWGAALWDWAGVGHIELYPRLQELLTRAVCEWAEVPLAEDEVKTRTRQLSALFDQAGAVGIGHFRSRAARRGAERWAAQIIEDIRAERRPVGAESAASVVANHRDGDGHLLEPRVAAVELLNVLRPTVATAVYICFVAHALDADPAWRQRITTGDGSEDHAFVEEVRRHYPFFPAVAAVVREEFQWQGHRFPQGRRVLLDLYGTNHDPRVWTNPFRFDPQRFLGPEPSHFAFVPQGGGDPAVDHRCPGEPISTRLMAVALDQLTRRMTYTPLRANSSVDFGRLPALPANGYPMRDVAPRQGDRLGGGIARTPNGRDTATP
jgi:fatty-acid peroxygenase